MKLTTYRSSYSAAVNSAATLEEARLACLNRSLANLNLGRFENALSDAMKAVQDGKPNESEKALFREAKALYGMKSYRECMQKLVVLTKEFPDSQAVKVELDRAQARLREQLKGQYSFRRMYKEAQAAIPIIDCATFTGPVEVRPSPGRGRGLFTTTAVAASDLLVCEKAFAYCYAGDDNSEGNSKTTILMDMETRNYAVGGQADLLSQVVQKLAQNPNSSKAFLDLHHGAYQAIPRGQDHHGQCLWHAQDQPCQLPSHGVGNRGKTPSTTTCGIWILASYLNHSCVGNCRRSFIGDMQIIRATRDIPADTELFFSYKQPESLTSFDETQQSLQNWGFQCGCALCLAKKATSDDTLKRRKALLAQLKYTMRPSIDPRAIDTKRALAVLEKVEATYAAPVRTNPAATDASKKAEAVKVTIKGFEALGFVITATPPKLGNNGPKKKAGNGTSDSHPEAGAGQLVVESWGVVVDYVVPAFLTLFRVYRATSPELANRAREYAATAYSMLVGEKETIYDEIPELRL
ncbi:hypothetical protein PG993_008780 [Apiospora rasikravindrae]|uniref:SET domain-containing protein n=1 Tax=Apiospora rasikravindrae TaxID=990691 RepID=A0ABR1SPA9_9PEZI